MKNYCSLANGAPEERRIWVCQSKKLISLCLVVLAHFDKSCAEGQDVVVTSLALRLLVHLTDLKGWKNITDSNRQNADVVVQDLVRFMGIGESGLYVSIRRYINTLDVPFSSQRNRIVLTDEKFLITASAMTLALRPFHMANSEVDGPDLLGVHYIAEKYCVFLLTIPWLVQRLPAVLVSAMKHKTILSPCLHTLLVSLVKFE